MIYLHCSSQIILVFDTIHGVTLGHTVEDKTLGRCVPQFIEETAVVAAVCSRDSISLIPQRLCA